MNTIETAEKELSEWIESVRDKLQPLGVMYCIAQWHGKKLRVEVTVQLQPFSYDRYAINYGGELIHLEHHTRFEQKEKVNEIVRNSCTYLIHRWLKPLEMMIEEYKATHSGHHEVLVKSAHPFKNGRIAYTKIEF